MANPATPWNFSLPLGVPTIPQAQEQQQHQQHSPSITSTIGERKQRTLRLSINARERRRMHDLNDALDELRSVVSRTEVRSAPSFLVFSFRFPMHIHHRYEN